jgi:hypothetical protein
MTPGIQAVESDTLWKAPPDLPTGLGKRGPYPVSHRSTQLRRLRNVLPMSLDDSVTYLPGTCMLSVGVSNSEPATRNSEPGGSVGAPGAAESGDRY